MLEFKTYPMENYRYVATFDESDLDDLGLPQEEIEQMFGSHDNDKFIKLIKEHGVKNDWQRDLNDFGREGVEEYGNYLIGIFTSVMGFEEWHLYEKI